MVKVANFHKMNMKERMAKLRSMRKKGKRSSSKKSMTEDVEGGRKRRRNTKRMNDLEELGRVDAEKATTKKGRRNLKAEKKRIVGEVMEGKGNKKGKGILGAIITGMSSLAQQAIPMAIRAAQETHPDQPLRGETVPSGLRDYYAKYSPNLPKPRFMAAGKSGRRMGNGCNEGYKARGLTVENVSSGPLA